MIVRPEHFEFSRGNAREKSELANDNVFTPAENELLDELAIDRAFFTDPPSFCFYCGEKLTIPAIMWHGRHPTAVNETREIWLHVKCSEAFGAGLMRDTDELKIGKTAADENLRQWKSENIR